MLFSPDRDVVVKPEYIQHATELGLVIPTIHVEDHLDKRLERHDRTIEFDDQALFDGTLELELEDPIAVTFGAYRKDIEKPEAEIDYEIKPKNAEVDLDVDATPTFEEGSEKKANIGLWLGVAVADALITHGKEVRSTREKNVLYMLLRLP